MTRRSPEENTRMILTRFHISLALCALAALSGAATLSSVTAWAADPTKVVIKDFMFSPMSVTVKAGATVTWVNRDDEPHTVVSDTGVFRSSGLDTDETFSYKFDKPGTYHITCSIHPRMVATIVVE
jgi:plastocyanin